MWNCGVRNLERCVSQLEQPRISKKKEAQKGVERGSNISVGVFLEGRYIGKEKEGESGDETAKQ